MYWQGMTHEDDRGWVFLPDSRQKPQHAMGQGQKKMNKFTWNQKQKQYINYFIFSFQFQQLHA